jgi:hypothetical protein
LDANFSLWFSFWFTATLISSLVYLFGEKKGLGLLLLQLLGTLLIALLTAMAAFNNMDINEKKKRAREEYDALRYFLHCQIQRFNVLSQLYRTIEVSMKSPSFSRGLAIPYILIDFDTDPINFNDINYFGTCIKNGAKENAQPLPEYQCVNIAYLSAFELGYKSLLKMVRNRNEIMKAKIMPVTNLNYIGAGKCEFPINAFKKSMPFAEFSNFLHISEEIMSAVEWTLVDLKAIIEGVSDKAEELVSKEIALENGGYPRFTLPNWKDNNDSSYVELTSEELVKFNSEDYPVSKNYRNYDSMEVSINWS